MKKQELIKTIKYLARETSQNYPHEEMVELPDVLNAINQLDEPELPVIPKFVAEWIEKYREHDSNVWHWIYNVNVQDIELWTWLWGENNVDELARAWLDGFTVENNIEIKICSSVFQVMKKYIQLGAGSLEAGGVLIGKENMSDDNIIIRYITEPYANDKRRYNRFIRKDKKHIDIFNEVFNSSNGIYRYIGEWHTHDEGLPDYSRLDLKNWKKIMKESPGNIEHFHIIVGNKAIRIWRFGKLLKNPDLIKTIYWKDVVDFDKKTG